MSAAKQAARIRQVRDNAALAWNGQLQTGLSNWEYDVVQTPPATSKDSPVVIQWEHENRSAWRRALENVWMITRRSTRTFVIVAIAFSLGFAAAAGPHAAAYTLKLRDQLSVSKSALLARQGELDLTRLELARLNVLMQSSERYGIPADLAAKIYDIALAEGIEPKIAFSLVSVESDFTRRAVSPKGALGLTQLMPSTARFFEPRIQHTDLFDPEINLRIGFRFLKELIAKYNGNVDMALHAYNRGPGVVDRVVASGGNPANGYAEAVMRGTQ